MGQEQLQKILDREDLPSDVKETIRDYLLETSFPPREKLLEDNELLSAILETSPVGICLFTESIFGWTNNTMTRMLGYDEDSLNGQLARILFTSNEEYSRVYQALFGVTDIFDVLKVETMWVHQDGSVINVILHGKPIDISNLGKGVIVAAMDVTESKFTEEKLKKSEKKHRDLINSLPGIVLETDLEGNFLFVSPQVLDILGSHPEEVIGKSGFEFIHPDDQETAMGNITKALEKQYISDFEYRVRHKKGHYVWVSASGRMVGEDPDIKLVIMIKDISYLKKTEEELQQSEERFRELIENSPDAIALTDLGGRIIMANKQGAMMLGYEDEQELIGMNGFEKIVPEERERAYENVPLILKNEKIGIDKYSLIKKDGAIFPVNINVSIIKDKEGDPTGFMTVLRDITERKQAEEALRESEKKYRELIGNLSDIVVELDSKGNFVFISSQAYEIFGYRPEEVIGKSGFEFIHPDDLEIAIKAFEKVMGGESAYHFEYKAKHKDGHYVPVSVSGQLIENDNTFKLVGVISDISERKQAEEALRRSEERYRQIIDNVKDIIFTLSDEWTITSLNPAFEKLTGWPCDEIIGKSMATLVHPEDISGAIKSLEMVMNGKVPPKTELRIKTRSDDYLIFDGRTTPQIEDGKITGFFGVARDITQQKQMEEELKKSEQRFRDLVNLLPQTVFETDTEGNVTFLNQYFIDNSAYTQEEIDKGLNALQLVIPEDRDRVIQNIRKTLSGEKTKNYEYTAMYKDGRTYPIIIYSCPIIHDKKTIGLRGIVFDISERKKAEEELKKFKTIADNAGYGVAISDIEGNLIYINDSFALMHGYNTGELIGKHLAIFHTKEQLKNVNKLVEQLKQKGSYVAEEVWHKRKDNTVFPTSMNGTLITDEKGTPQFMAATSIDISERKKTEEVRLELEQRRENFVWMTSHELRTPLTVVTGYVDFLHENIDSIDQDQRIKIFKSIKNNLIRLEKLTMDVSTVAQFGRGIFKLAISDIDFCTFFQQAIEPYQDVLGNQLEFYGCQREPPLIIEGDKERLRQVLDNLVNNAIKQTPPDFRLIKVHLEIHSANVRITMKDNGAGIASDNLEKIFEQFVSIETEYSATGTGIGLYLSRKIIEAHGGTITPQSKGLGQGTTLIINLPINFPDN